jgi:hypothetical protein
MKTNLQKTFHEIRRKKTMIIKINDVIKKTLFHLMIIKDSMQKLTIMKKRKENILSVKLLLSDDLKLLTNTKKAKKRIKKDRALTYNISFSTTTIRQTYVVLTHDMSMKIINVLNQQKVIIYIVKQNLNLHKKFVK